MEGTVTAVKVVYCFLCQSVPTCILDNTEEPKAHPDLAGDDAILLSLPISGGFWPRAVIIRDGSSRL